MLCSVRQSERDRDEAEQRTLTLQRLADNLDDQIKDHAVQMAQSHDDATQYRANATQMRFVVVFSSEGGLGSWVEGFVNRLKKAHWFDKIALANRVANYRDKSARNLFNNY